MKSIKPGRGPSALGAIGSVAVGAFGVIWTIGASSMGAPPFFVLFGFIFIGLAIIQGIFHFKNATGTNRMSLLDITDNNSEPDPLDLYIRQNQNSIQPKQENNIKNFNDVNYCPFCGNQILDVSYKFCGKCGKEIRN